MKNKLQVCRKDFNGWIPVILAKDNKLKRLEFLVHPLKGVVVYRVLNKSENKCKEFADIDSAIAFYNSIEY